MSESISSVLNEDEALEFEFDSNDGFDVSFTDEETIDAFFMDDDNFDAGLEGEDSGAVFTFDGFPVYLHAPIASKERLGIVQIGDRLSITEEGLLSADEQIPEDDYTLITNLDINQILNS